MVTEVRSKSDLQAFVKFPLTLYRHNKQWAPPLLKDELQTFDPRYNAALQHVTYKLFLAKINHRTVGRIAGIINHRENQKDAREVARFGWVDFIDDQAVSRALFSKVEQWIMDQGIQRIKGPYGFSNMDKAGLLTDGFDELSTMAVIYNYDYYPRHIETLGYEKLVDYHEYVIKVPDAVPPKVDRIAELIAKRYQLSVLSPKNKTDLLKTGREIFQMINRAYEHLEGFIPHTDAMIDQFVHKYLTLLNPDFISVIRDKHGELAGFGITMPSLTRALQKARGRLWPFGWYHLKKALQKNDRADLYLIAVRPDLQNKGVTALIFSQLIQTFIRYGIETVETNPELESNQEVQNLWRGYDLRQHKTRRCYHKTL